MKFLFTETLQIGSGKIWSLLFRTIILVRTSLAALHQDVSICGAVKMARVIVHGNSAGRKVIRIKVLVLQYRFFQIGVCESAVFLVPEKTWRKLLDVKRVTRVCPDLPHQLEEVLFHFLEWGRKPVPIIDRTLRINQRTNADGIKRIRKLLLRATVDQPVQRGGIFREQQLQLDRKQVLFPQRLKVLKSVQGLIKTSWNVRNKIV